MAWVNHLKRPVMLKRKTKPETVKPADVVCVMLKRRDMATAAIA